MGKKNSKLAQFDIMTPSLYSNESYFIQEYDLDHVRNIIDHFLVQKDYFQMDLKQFTELIIVGKKLKVSTDDFIKSIEDGIKKFYKVMRCTESRKVNIFELFILMVVLGRADLPAKMKLILQLLDFEKKKTYSSEQLLIFSTMFVVAVSRLYTIRMNSFSNKDLLEFVHTLGEAYKVHQNIDLPALIQWLETEDVVVNFFKLFEYPNTHNARSLAPVENKKFYNTVLRDTQKLGEYVTLNRKEEHTVEKKAKRDNKHDVIHEEDKESVMVGNRRVTALLIKQVYVWFMGCINEYGTISNRLNYMTFVEQLNTIKAKQLTLIDELIGTLDWFVERNIDEISVQDICIAMFFRREWKVGSFDRAHPVFDWVDRFDKTIEMDRSRIKQRIALIELRKLFWQVDKNRSGTIDFDEYFQYVSSVYTLQYAKEKFKSADKDKNADVDYLEFCRLMMDYEFDEKMAEEIMNMPESKVMSIQTNELKEGAYYK